MWTLIKEDVRMPETFDRWIGEKKSFELNTGIRD